MHSSLGMGEADPCPGVLPGFSSRPLSIFEGGDPTLDPNAIANAMSPPDRLLSGVLTLVLCMVLALGVVFFPDTFTHIQWDQSTFKTVKIALTQDGLGLQAPELRKGRPGGGQGGTGTIDPRREFVAASLPANDLGLEMIDRSASSLNQTLLLPFASGGDGLLKGRGPGSGGGTGGENGSGNWGVGTGGKAPDYMLLATHSPILFYQLKPGQTQGPCIVVVNIIIEADGHVSNAKCVSGPAFLHATAEQCALKWTFEPLGARGVVAPYHTKINFHYKP